MRKIKWSSVEWDGKKPFPHIHLHAGKEYVGALGFSSLAEMERLSQILAIMTEKKREARRG